MTIDSERNLTSFNNQNPDVPGKPYGLVELGSILWFGGNIQKFYKCTGFTNLAHPLSGDVDLLELQMRTKILPIIFKEQ